MNSHNLQQSRAISADVERNKNLPVTSAAQAIARDTLGDAPCPLLHPRLGARRRIELTKKNAWYSLPKQEGQVRMLLAVNNTVQIDEGGVHHILEAAAVFHCRPEQAVRIRATGSGITRLLELTFDDELSCNYLGELLNQYGRPLTMPSGKSARTGHRPMLAVSEPDERAVFKWLSLLHESACLRRTNLGMLLHGGPAKLAEFAVRNRFSLKSIAYELGCHQSHLSKCWNNSGYPPLVPLLRTQRLALAKQLLSCRDMTLSSIANQCGYSGMPAFSLFFRQSEGTSPGAWRQQQLQQVSQDSRSIAPRVRSASASASVKPLPAEDSHDENPISIWGAPYFQFDGGITAKPYLAPFNLAINTITHGITWVCTLEGSAVFRMHDHELKVEPGMVVVYPKPMFGSWITPQRRPWKRIWIIMRDQWSIQAMETLTHKYGWASKIPLESLPVTIAGKSVGGWNAGRGTPSVARSREAYNWLLHWEQQLSSDSTERIELPDLRKYRSPTFDRKMSTISSFSKSIGYSRSYLSRRLSMQWVGGTPSQIVRRHRLLQAAHDLSNGNDSIDTISKRSLYAHTSAFIAAFKREYGMTPLAYRYRKTVYTLEAQK